ncbi:capsular polysaccharide biosynthesis protein [Chitiniphilus shinanonensis]|uniref:Capsular polysaccharide biosynthesis protein n=1 Tax=Chitiniphilus shinanonensis TaxID=553088 RepID=A0ABQ6BSP6_9NEIS|nr:hypothetical protein [Chitiniphilus shinanonensis]GLS04633.1 capsular polysaccharide biosynthesis protein [Chitiniphilus shinanonensis]
MTVLRSLSWPSRATVQAALLLLILAGFSLLAGAAIGMLGAKAAAGVLGATAILVLFFVPPAMLVWAMLGIAFVVVGQAIYFLRLEQANWLPALLGLVLYLRLPMEALIHRDARGGGQAMAPVLLLLGFILIGAFSSALYWSGLWQFLLGGKDYLWILSFFFFLLLTQRDLSLYQRALSLVPWAMIAQVPFVLYQVIFVVPTRTAGARWDSVVGSFGGDPQGGGASGAMAVFLLVGCFACLGLYRQRRIAPALFWGAMLAALLCIGMAEVKVVFMLLPLLALYLYADVLFRRPLQFIVGAILLCLLLWGGLTVYFKQFGENQVIRDLPEYIEHTIELTVDPNMINMETGEMGRVAAIALWADRHFGRDLHGTLVGHGVGSVKVAKTLIGSEARHYFPQFRLGRSSLAILLWESGLAGTALLCGFFLLLSHRARRLAMKVAPDSFHAPWLRATSAAMLTAVLLLIYNTDVMAVPVMQVFLLFLAAYTVLAGKLLGGDTEARAS